MAQEDRLLEEEDEVLDHDLDEWQEEEFEKCSESFSYFAKTYVKITHPKRGLVPFVLYGYQERFIDAVQKNRFVLVSKFRQGGLTTVTIVFMLWLSIFRTDQQILIVSIGDREAVEAGRKLKNAIENLPDWLKPRLGKNNDHEKEFVDTNCNIQFRSPKGVRSASLSWLIVDEAAFIGNMEELWAGMMPTLATGGNCVVVSTSNGMGNWYQEYYYDALEGKNDFKVVEMEYWENPDYADDEWVRFMQAQLGPRRWKQEVLRSFLGGGSTYIDSDIIVKLDNETRNDLPRRKLFPEWDAPMEMLDSKGKAKVADLTNITFQPGALWIWGEPERGHEYVLACDVAAGIGTEGDYSAFHVIDMATCEQVAEFYSNMVTPHVFAEVVAQTGTYYNGAQVVVENQQDGKIVLNRLVNDPNLCYENLYWEKQDKAGLTVQLNRPTILDALHYAITAKVLKIRSRRLVNEIKTFEYSRQKKKPMARPNKHDDLVMAMAIAMFIRDESGRRLPPMDIGALAGGGTTDNDYHRGLFEQIKAEILREAPEDWADVASRMLQRGDQEDPELEPVRIWRGLRRQGDMTEEILGL
jgi:hypothetical protein